MKGQLISRLTMGILILLSCFIACTGQSNPTDNSVPIAAVQQTKPFGINAKVVSDIGKDIRNILQDKNKNYWFATYGQGVYYNDGKTLFQFTDKDGLCSNFVSDMQEDTQGNIWFNTSAGLCKFDGEKFRNYTDTLKNVSTESLAFHNDDLFFAYQGLVYRYDGKAFTKFIIHPKTYQPSATNLDRPFGVYCILKDRLGNLWFGTDQRGVCRFDGKTFTYFTEHGLDKGAVRTIFEDKNGQLWFGNNGHGLFTYDGKKLINFTEEKGLANPDFLNKQTTFNSKANLARVWAINEDKEGNLWIGSIDNGAWKYDGKELKNFTTKEGLPNNKVSSIYKDRQNLLWFITEGEGVSKWNGKSFERLNGKMY